MDSKAPFTDNSGYMADMFYHLTKLDLSSKKLHKIHLKYIIQYLASDILSLTNIKILYQNIASISSKYLRGHSFKNILGDE